MRTIKTAITLLSGGIDSYLSTAIARDTHKILLALTFDYGQRSVAREITAAKRMAALWRVRHETVAIPWLRMLGESALTHRGNRLPHFFDAAKLKSKRHCDKTAEAVWVPNRNGVFLNIAAAYAESLGANTIVTGFNREEATTFPDNSADYVHRVNRSLELSTLQGRPKVKSFVQKMNKKEMVAEMLRRDLSFEFFWSCYDGEAPKMCGLCESCARLKSALKANHLLEKYGFRFG